MSDSKKSEKQLPERSEDWLMAIFNAVPDSIFVKDRLLAYTHVNPAMERLLGKPASELIGQTDEALFGPEAGSQSRDLDIRVLDGEVVDEEVTKPVKGVLVTFHVVKVPLRTATGEVVGLCGVARDVTESKKAKEALERARVELEQRVQDRTSELTHTNERLLEQIEERRQVEQKLEIHQQQLQTLASQLSLTEQRERWKIATGLHDRVGQNLAFALLKLQSIHQGEQRADLKKTLGGVCEYIKKSIQEIRTLIFDLGSPILYRDGFEPALKDWLTEHIEKVHGIDCEYRDDGQPKPLDNDIMVLLFDSVREILVNVVKHAGAKKIKVNIYRDDDNMEIIIEDDGIGFDPAGASITPGRIGGFGLFSIRERLDYIHGRFEINSGHGRGTKITLRVPLKNV